MENNQNPVNPPVMSPVAKSNNALIISVVVVAVLLIGGIYYSYRLKAKQEMMEAQQMMDEKDGVETSLRMQSESDELKDIGADLDNTDTDNMGR